MRTRRPRPNRCGCLDLWHRTPELPCPYCNGNQVDVLDVARRLHARRTTEEWS